MTPAAFAGSYADIKLVKTRSVFQVVVELPIEQYQPFVAAFGGPLPGSERPVALALLNASPGAETPSASPDAGQQRGEPGKPQTPRKHWSEMSRAQQAGILSNDLGFKLWLSVNAPEGIGALEAAAYIREHCGVTSRAYLDTDDAAARKWDQLVAQFHSETGRLAEMRG